MVEDESSKDQEEEKFSFSVSARSCLVAKRGPAGIVCLCVTVMMLLTFVALYLNYYDAAHDRPKRGPSLIVDHWGKEVPTRYLKEFVF